MSYLAGVGQVVGAVLMVSAVPALVATEHFGAKYLQKHYPPEVHINHRKDDIVIHEGVSYKVLGYSGHAKSTIDNFDTTSGREVWYGDLSMAQKYAKMNAGKREEAIVAVIGQAVGAPEVPQGDSRYDNGFAPILPKAEHKVRVISKVPVDLRTDATIKACMGRCIAHKTNKLDALFSKAKIITSKHLSCPSEHDVWLAPISILAERNGSK